MNKFSNKKTILIDNRSLSKSMIKINMSNNLRRKENRDRRAMQNKINTSKSNRKGKNNQRVSKS